jgi:hypothetical protein
MPTVEERGYVYCKEHNLYFITAQNLCPLCFIENNIEEILRTANRYKNNIAKKNKEIKSLKDEVASFREGQKADTAEEEGSI